MGVLWRSSGTAGLSPTAAVSGTAGVSGTADHGPHHPAGIHGGAHLLPKGIAGQSGVEYVLGATALSVFNGSPSSYTPFEMGWRFANGVHIRSGIDLFYYEGPDTDPKQPDQVAQRYYYEMQ